MVACVPLGVRILVARDRAGAYAEGIRQGAPDAVQVTDRWHLLRNLGDTVRAVVDRQHVDIRRVAKQQAASTPEIRVTTGEAASTRQIARQLMTDDILPQTEQNFVSRVLLQVPGLAECVAAAKRLNAVLRRKSKEALDKVLEDAADTALGSFVTSLRRDLLPWRRRWNFLGPPAPLRAR